ncbi:hypothetical protein ACIRPG_37010, partial [Streptomyces sp. NPDC101754]
DWSALRTLGVGARSPLAPLAPGAGGDVVTAAVVATIAGVGRATITTWRRRHADFPTPTGGTATSPTFDRRAVGAWLLARGKITPTEPPPASRLLLHTGLRLDLFAATLTADGDVGHRLAGFADPSAAEELTTTTTTSAGVQIAHAEGLAGREPFSAADVMVEVSGTGFGGRLRRVVLSWPGPLRRPELWQHSRPWTVLGDPADCSCVPAVCGALLVDDDGCALHGRVAGPPAMEHHRAGNIRCLDLAARRGAARA